MSESGCGPPEEPQDLCHQPFLVLSWKLLDPNKIHGDSKKTTRARYQESCICLFKEESRKGVWVYKPKVISKRFCWVYISWFSESPGNASFVALGVRTGQKPKLWTLLAAVHMSGALKSSCADTHSPAFGPFPSIGFTSAFQEQA